VSSGHKDVAEVTDGVVFDVMHVTQAAEHIGLQRQAAERLEVDVTDLELLGETLIGVDVETHGVCSLPDRSEMSTAARDLPSSEAHA